MNNVILSGDYPIFGESLAKFGYHVIFSEKLPQLIDYEQSHADMQCLILDDTAGVLKECTRLAEYLKDSYHVVLTDDAIGGKYPANVRLNAAVLGKTVIANLKALDRKVIDYCREHQYRMLHVNQGYAKCSCAIVSDNAIITADSGIYYSLKETNIDVLKIQQGRVRLDGAEYGFIGGASGLDTRDGKRTLYFAGNIATHPDYPMIRTFCEAHDTETVSLTDTELIDIGGMLFC